MQYLRTLTALIGRKCPTGLVIIAVLAMTPSNEARAQSLFGSSGALSSTASSNGGGRSTGGASSFGGSSTGGGMVGGGARSGAAAAGGMGGQSSLTQTSLNMGDGSLGATVGTSGFVGRGDTAGRFVGSQNASRQRVVGGAQQFSALQNRNNQNVNNNTTPPRQLMQPRVQLGFESPLAIEPPVAGILQSRIASLPALGNRAAGVSLHLDEAGLVTLTGTVANEDDRRMMEILTRMEPGVRDVRNELEVSP